MSKKAKKGINIVDTKQPATYKPVNLGELRSRFDGLRDVAKKMPDGTQKNSLMVKIEELYLAAANWATGISGSQATA